MVEKWSGFVRHGDMGMVAEDDKWRERYRVKYGASVVVKRV